MRLDKYVSQCTALSRREVGYALREKRISVNGDIARSASMKIGDDDRVSLDGQALAPAGPRYWMLHKPAEYVCARTDASQPCVTDLLPPEAVADLQLVGRLDKDTTGLLLITDDGQWNHRITSPKRQCPKVYRVTTADPIAAETAARFAEGVVLRDDPAPTLPATLEVIDSHSARLTLREGRYHQVKRMFAAQGNRVVALHRESVGGIELDPDLAPGDYRALTPEEIARV